MNLVDDEVTRRVQAAIEDIKQGKMVIVVDDEDRENEGDLCMAAELVSPESINFMAKYARGLICISLTEERVHALQLPMMVERSEENRHTAFTVSIEACEGVTTGISAADRAHTIRVAVNTQAGPNDIVSPGHVFPLKGRPGGVLQRTGHTEGSIDLARLAGCSPAGVICEIMKDDGSMARLPDLKRFSSKHCLRIISIADLVEYRLRTEKLVHCVDCVKLNGPKGEVWEARIYRIDTDNRQILTVSLGSMHEEPTLVRVHTLNLFEDIFRIGKKTSVSLQESMDVIRKEGRGAVILFPSQLSPQAEVQSHLSGKQVIRGPHAHDHQSQEVLREYGIGAQIIRDLGLRRLRIITSAPRRLPNLDGYGLEVMEQLQISAL